MEFNNKHFAATATSRKQSILVIDDSPESLYLGKTLLEREGFNVFTASSGTEAFNILNGICDLNLVLLDMQMEDMSGICFLELLEKWKPNFLSYVPVVFYSAVDSVPLSKAAGFIRKAGDLNQFVKQVHGYIKLH